MQENRTCCITTCENHLGAKGTEIYFFKFPSPSTEIGNNWQKALNGVNIVGNSVCNLHFNAKDVTVWSVSGIKYRKLNPEAVPSIIKISAQPTKSMMKVPAREMIQIVDIEAIKNGSAVDDNIKMKTRRTFTLTPTSTPPSSLQLRSKTEVPLNETNNIHGQKHDCAQCKNYLNQLKIVAKRCEELEKENKNLKRQLWFTVKKQISNNGHSELSDINLDQDLSENKQAESNRTTLDICTRNLKQMQSHTVIESSSNHMQLSKEFGTTAVSSNVSLLTAMKPITESAKELDVQPEKKQCRNAPSRLTQDISSRQLNNDQNCVVIDSDDVSSEDDDRDMTMEIDHLSNPTQSQSQNNTEKMANEPVKPKVTPQVFENVRVPFDSIRIAPQARSIPIMNEDFKRTAEMVVIAPKRIRASTPVVPTDATKPKNVCTHSVAFKHSKQLAIHMRECHSSKFHFECYICKITFVELSKLRMHIKTHSDARTHRCEICNEMFTKKELNEHLCGSKKSINCEFCEHSFKTTKKILQHIEKEHEYYKAIHRCGKCGRYFPTIDLRDLHEKCHEGKPSFVCDLCSKVFHTKHRLSSHMKCHTTERNFLCSECGKGFKTNQNLRYHRKIHEEKTIECPDCPAKFSNIPKFKKHREQHLNLKLKCTLCSTVLSSRRGLLKHIRMIHNATDADKKYGCSYCSFKFKTSYKLKVHLRQHTGERPFTCEYCFRNYAYKQDYTKHLKTHVGNKIYKCETCGQRFAYYMELKQHTFDHYKENKKKLETNAECDVDQ